MNSDDFKQSKKLLSDPNYIESTLKELIERGFLKKGDAGSSYRITEKGRQWMEEIEQRIVSAKPKVSDEAPPPPKSDAELLRRMFRLATTEQVKQTAGRLIRKRKDGTLVVDKRVAAELRTFAYKNKLAKELEKDNKNPPA